MRESKKVPIDGRRLEAEIFKRNLNKVQASEKIGYSHAYLANCGSQGFISTKAMKLLEAVLAIRYEDVKPCEPIVPKDSNLIQLSKVKEQKEKIEFFETCEEKISNAVVTLNVCLDMIDQLLVIREQVENDMKELMTVQDVYQKTLKRVKEAS